MEQPQVNEQQLRDTARALAAGDKGLPATRRACREMVSNAEITLAIGINPGAMAPERNGAR
jgi:hypothetical protein